MLAASGCPKMPKTPHSSLNLSMSCSRCALSCKYRASIADRPRPARRRRPPHRSRRRPADGDPQPIAAGLADDARRHARRRRPLEHLGDIVGRHRSDDARGRFAEERRRVVDARDRARPRRASIDASAPMPLVSKQHSASVTARPPSEQSCADRISRVVGERDEQRLQRALARRGRAPAARRAPDRARSSGYSLPPSSPRPSPSSTIASPAP